MEQTVEEKTMYTLEEFQQILDTRFGGALRTGSHTPDEDACALELLSVVQGQPWTDDPTNLECWDLRPLNDIPVDPQLRTEELLPLLVAYQKSRRWLLATQSRVASRIANLTVQRLVAELPGLPDTVRRQCRKAMTLMETVAAAEAARAAAVDETEIAVATWSVRAAWLAEIAMSGGMAAEAILAAEAARAAAEAAAEAAGPRQTREETFRRACVLWLDAAAC